MKNTIENTFKNFARLPARVAIYVPGTSGPAAADSALAERMTAETAGALSDLFGGATISLAAGAWMSAELGLIREDVQIVYSFAALDALDAHAADVLRIAQRVKTEMHQEAVSVEINGALYLI